MKKQFTLTYQKSYHFYFEFDFDQLMVDNVEYYPLSVKLYRKDSPASAWSWNNDLFPGQEVRFRMACTDGINIKGEFHLFHSQPSHEDLLFLDAWFGPQYEEHFEGNIFVLGFDPDPLPPLPPDPIPDPEPPVPPADDPAPETGEDRVLPSGYHDLFPFLQLRFWPDLTPAEEELFIEYSDNGTLPPSADLYTQLLAREGQPSARVEMEKEARLFINGSAGYAGLFIDNREALPSPFDSYPGIYDFLIGQEGSTPESLQSAFSTLAAASANTSFSFGSSDYACELNIIWQNVFALAIISGYRVTTLEMLLKVLIVDHLLRFVFISPILSPILPPDVAPPEPWRRLIRSSVVLPEKLFPLPAEGPVHLPGSPADPPAPLTEPPRFSGRVVPYAIGCLQKVQHCHTGYASGEIAMVENIGIGEVKQVKHRHTLFTEEKTDHRTVNQADRHHSNSGTQLEQEVSRALDQTIKNEWDFTKLSISYGPPTTGTYDGKVDNTQDTRLKSDSSNQFARKILAAAVDRVAEAVIHHRQTTLRQETEEMVLRTIDNRRGARNIRSIYRWLNKIYQLRLVDYGRRFIVEFLIEQPARLPVDGPAETPARPLPPDRLPVPILSYKDITVENFSQLATRYGVTGLPFPPPGIRKVTALLDASNFFPAKNLPVPEGYLPVSLTANYKLAQPAVLIAGTKQVSLSTSDTSITIADPMQLTGSDGVAAVPLLLDLSSSDPYYCSVVMECTIAPDTFGSWQLTVFDRIWQAYRATQQQNQQSKEEGWAPRNPQIGERSLRLRVADACLSVLYQLHNDGDVPARPEFTQFDDDAFEWPEMSFSVQEDRWPRHMRVLVPVRPNFSFRVLYYLSTGIPYYGCDRLTPVIEKQKRIAAALQRAEREGRCHVRETQLDTWQVTVPTSMQWLQDDDRLPGLK